MSSKIEKINREVCKANTNLNYYEKEYLNLIATNALPEIKGEVYSAIVNMYACDVKNNYEKVIYYSPKALKYSLNVLQTCKIYLNWGRAIESGKRHVPGLNMRVGFGDPIVPYLKGLGFVLEHLRTEKRLFPSGAFKYCMPPSTPGYQEVVKRHEEASAKRKEAKIQNELLDYRRQFRRQIWRVCPEIKSNASKLSAVVKHAVADTNSADKVIQYLVRPVTNEMSDAF